MQHNGKKNSHTANPRPRLGTGLTKSKHQSLPCPARDILLTTGSNEREPWCSVKALRRTLNLGNQGLETALRNDLQEPESLAAPGWRQKNALSPTRAQAPPPARGGAFWPPRAIHEGYKASGELQGVAWGGSWL